MKIQSKIIAGVLMVGILSASSCKKDEDNSVKARLTGSWDLTQTGSDANNNSIMEATEVESVSADTAIMAFTFNGDGTGALSTDFLGASLSYDFSWTLINNDEDIKISVLTQQSTMHIQSLTSSELVIKDTSGTTGTTSSATWNVFKKK